MSHCHRYDAVGIAFLAVFGLLFFVSPAAAQSSMILEYHPLEGRFDDSIPPDGSMWHELHPPEGFCTDHPQDGYEDNDQDGRVSVCDGLISGGIRYHIEWVGPTYWLTNLRTRDVRAMEPRTFDLSSRSPVCEMWHTIIPPEEYCTEHHVEFWEEMEPNGIVDFCDYIYFDGDPAPWHVDEVNLNIEVIPESPVRKTTWGKVKEFFYSFFK